MNDIELNKIYNENCVSDNPNEGMNRIPDKSIDLIVCDLPYGVTARNKWDQIIPFDKLWSHYERVIKDDGIITLTAVKPFSAMLMMSNPKLYRYDIIWRKNKATGHLNAKKMPLRSHEEILIFYKKLGTYNPQKTTGHKRKVSKAEHKVNCKQTSNYGNHGLTTYDSTERYPTSIWDIAVMNNDDPNKFHPTQKPVELFERIIKTYSNEGSVVLDNCSGAGTTAIACMNTNRNYICFEWNEDEPRQYYDKSVEWIEKHKNKLSHTLVYS